VRIHWAPEDVAYISTRSQRYPGAIDIEVDWLQEVLADPQLVQVTPYPRSRSGASAFIAYSAGADRVLVVIAYQDLDGDWHGMNSWPASARDLATYLEGKLMTKRLDPDTASKVRADARKLEKHADDMGNYPAGTTVRRGQGPSRMFNVRLTVEQYQQLEQVARAKHLPLSTMARAWLLDRLQDEKHAS
jgi:hypothetical protein